MTDIFISYARSAQHSDHNVASSLRDRLVSMGLSVFWDRDIRVGEDFARVLDEKARVARLVLCLWSSHSLGQDWVLNECRQAKARNALFPILVDAAANNVIPVEFNNLQHIAFDELSEPSWRALISGLATKLDMSDLPTRFDLSIKPLIAESTTAESTNIKTILDDMRRDRIMIPDYQRDGGEWDGKTKSEFIESVINNLAIPAFFFEPELRDGRETNSVVDGQQRLTTLEEFYLGKFRLNNSDSADYISPNSIYYAGKSFGDLPVQFRESLESYRLTIIKLRNLGDMRLEVFRRINSGGEPLSDQDIRLAYYGENSPTVAFVRIAGIYDPTRKTSERFLASAHKNYQVAYPWSGQASELWKGWWADKVSAIGQAPSELFLLSLVAAQFKQLNRIASDPELLSSLRIHQTRTLSHALNIYCACSAYEDAHPDRKRLLMTLSEMRDQFFPHFREAFERFVSDKKKFSMLHSKQMAMVIGAMYRSDIRAKELSGNRGEQLRQLVRSPRNTLEVAGRRWPAGKGIWSGASGHSTQMRELSAYLRALFKRPTEVDEP